ncbi:hypothetical protein ACIBCN_37065 [Nocardia sp. NPDC051052]|uniref:hypothetical protein n=1 Tax=Nocardia sp. NPDC051052 TaxID=3364322 RepID=UPI0037AD7EB6
MHLHAGIAPASGTTGERAGHTGGEHPRIQREWATGGDLVGETATDHAADTTGPALHQTSENVLELLVEPHFSAEETDEISTQFAEQMTECATQRATERELPHFFDIETLAVVRGHLAQLDQDILNHLEAGGTQGSDHDFVQHLF